MKAITVGALNRQRGFALVVGLIFLLVLTILGVTALRTTTLEERMAGNLQKRTLAFQDAESAIVQFLRNVNSATTILSTGNDCSATSNFKSNIEIHENKLCSGFIGSTDPGRLVDTAEGVQIRFNHFRVDSQSQTDAGGVSVEINQGFYQRGPKTPGVLTESTEP